jgi:hypothetical protein
MISVTLDTNLFILVIKQRPGYQKVKDILTAHRDGVISAVISSRAFQPDTLRMGHETKEKFHEMLSSYKIFERMPSRFRWGISVIGGVDLLSGGYTGRTPEEILEFKRISLGDPVTRPDRQPKTLDKSYNDIGDYDALYDHFCNKRDVYLTKDHRRVFSLDKRPKYISELGLVVQDPDDFVIPVLD